MVFLLMARTVPFSAVGLKIAEDTLDENHWGEFTGRCLTYIPSPV